MALEYYDECVQVTHQLTEEECIEVNDFLKDHPDKPLRLIWFKDSDELKFIKNLPNVRKLQINYCSLENIDFIASLQGLEMLEISEMEGNVNVEAIKDLQCLKVLNLTLNKATRQTDLSIISPCTSLEEFYFSGKFKKNSLDINSLKSIRILAPQLNTLNLQDIGSLENLKILKLFGQKAGSLEGLEKLTSIEKIHISNLRMVNQDQLSPIFQLPHLKTLGLSYVKFIQNFSFIKEKHNLETLILWTLNSLESYKGIESLKGLKKLSHCGSHTAPNAIDFENIYSLKELTELEIKVGKLNKENQEMVTKLELLVNGT